MSEQGVDITQLPQDVRDKLAELDLELSEGEWWDWPWGLLLFTSHRHTPHNNYHLFYEV